MKLIELAKKRDHRKLGKDLHLFGVQENAGAGLWFWYPRGAVMRELIHDWWKKEHTKQRFSPIFSPDIVKKSFLEETGFFDTVDGDHDKPLPSFSQEDGEYSLLPSRVPYHALVFRSVLRSYRDLPLRYCEWGSVHAYQRNDQLRGMCKARSHTIDEGTIFCTEEQVYDEVVSSLQFILKTTKIFGFEYKCYLTARGRRYAGTIRQWRKLEKLLADMMDSCGYEYSIDDHDNVFLGPTVHVRIKDALGREWDGPFISVDLSHAQRLGLRYQGADGDMHTPMMIRRSLFGSLESFVALLVEHYAGVFPLWITPEQVRVLPVSEKNEGYAETVRNELESHDLRVGTDYRQEKLAARMRAAQCDKVPYVVVLGDDEEERKMVAVRQWNSTDTWRVRVDALRDKLLEEVSAKKIFVRDFL